MSLEDILRSSFTLARQRIGLLFLDVLWKIIWVVLTVAILFLAVVWFTSGVQTIEWEETGIPALNGLIATALLQQFWNANRGELIITILTAFFLSAAVWVFLEACFRRKIVSDVCERPPAVSRLSAFVRGTIVEGGKGALTTRYPLNVFLASAVSKSAILLTGAVFVVVVSWLGAAVVGIVTLCGTMFLLTLFDTLVRADAVDLLGTDLIRVAGLLGILMSFESMVVASFVTFLVAGFLNTAGQADALAVLAASFMAAVLLTLLHSYLLLVRFSAITIMRRNVVEV